MGLWQRTKHFISGLARKSRTFRAIFRRTGLSPSFNIDQWQDFAKEGPEKNPYVYSVIDNIQTSAASIPPRLFRIQDGGAITAAQEGYDRKAHAGHYHRHKKRRAALRVIRGRTEQVQAKMGLSAAPAKERAIKALVERGELEVIEGHELIDLLDRPNPWYQKSYNSFIKSVVGALELGGEAYFEPVFASDTAEIPRELYVHAPEGVDFSSSDRSRRPVEEIEVAGATFQYEPDPTESEIWYIKYWHPRNPLRGLPPIRAAAHSIDINNEGRGWNLSLLQNGAEISGILSFEEGLDTEAQDRLATQFKEAIEPGSVVTTDGSKFNFQQTSMSPKDMQWGDLSTMSAKEVAITWNVPPEITGFDESKTFANFETANRVFHQSKILPLMDFVFGELNSTLVPLFGDDLLLDYDTSGVEALQEEEDALHERVREDWKVGLLDLHGALEALGRDTEGVENIRIIPSTVVPLSAVTTQTSDERAAQMLPEGEEDPLRLDGDGLPQHEEIVTLESNGEANAC